MEICCILQSGRMDICSRAHIEDTPMWVEVGLAIGGGECGRDTLQRAWSKPHPPPRKHSWAHVEARTHSGACNAWVPDGRPCASRERDATCCEYMTKVE